MFTPSLWAEILTALVAVAAVLLLLRKKARKRAAFQQTEPFMRAALLEAFPQTDALIRFYDHNTSYSNPLAPRHLQNQVDKLIDARNRLFDRWYDIRPAPEGDHTTLAQLARTTLDEFKTSSDGVEFQDAYTLLATHHAALATPSS